MTSRDIWVVGALRGDQPSPWTLELVSGAANLAAQAGARVSVLIPRGAGGNAALLGTHGAAAVTYPPVTAACTAELMSEAVGRCVDPGSALAVLLPDSVEGRDVGARVAASLHSPLATSCERVLLGESHNLQVLRRCYRGQVSQRLDLHQLPAVLTVAEQVFRPRKSAAGTPEERDLSFETDSPTNELVRRLVPTPDELNVEDAPVIVSGGRGVGEQGFTLLSRVAQLLGGTTAATRVAVDLGWAPKDRQVGQTGKSVAPQLYLACGISGAIQHMAGIREAGSVVAINLDEHAPIMSQADLAVVGDASAILARLIHRLSEEGAGA